MLSSENEAGGTALKNLVRLDWGLDSFDDWITCCKEKWSAMIIELPN